MDKDSNSLAQTPLRPNGPVDERPMMVRIRAFYMAREQVKQALKREGHIVSQYKASAISELEKQLFEANRERMLAEAKARISQWPEYQKAGQKYEAAMAKRAAKVA